MKCQRRRLAQAAADLHLRQVENRVADGNAAAKRLLRAAPAEDPMRQVLQGEVGGLVIGAFHPAGCSRVVGEIEQSVHPASAAEATVSPLRDNPRPNPGRWGTSSPHTTVRETGAYQGENAMKVKFARSIVAAGLCSAGLLFAVESGALAQAAGGAAGGGAAGGAGGAASTGTSGAGMGANSGGSMSGGSAAGNTAASPGMGSGQGGGSPTTNGSAGAQQGAGSQGSTSGNPGSSASGSPGGSTSGSVGGSAPR
jgi:hypothetical protein